MVSKRCAQIHQPNVLAFPDKFFPLNLALDNHMENSYCSPRMMWPKYYNFLYLIFRRSFLLLFIRFIISMLVLHFVQEKRCRSEGIVGKKTYLKVGSPTSWKWVPLLTRDSWGPWGRNLLGPCPRFRWNLVSGSKWYREQGKMVEGNGRAMMNGSSPASNKLRRKRRTSLAAFRLTRGAQLKQPFRSPHCGLERKRNSCYTTCPFKLSPINLLFKRKERTKYCFSALFKVYN